MNQRLHPRFKTASPPPVKPETLAANAPVPTGVDVKAVQKEATIADMNSQMIRDNLHKGITEISKSIDAARRVTRRVIPENIFRAHYLAVFSGEYREHDLAERIRLWGVIADGFYGEVDVQNNQGQVIAVVPSLLNRELIKLDLKPAGGGMREVVRLSGERAAASPQAAENMVYAELNNRFVNNEGLHRAQQSQQEKWEKLLNHFGKSLSGRAVVNQKGKMAEPDDELEFE